MIYFILILILISLVLALIVFKNLDTIQELKEENKILDRSLRSKELAILDYKKLKAELSDIKKEYNEKLEEFKTVVKTDDPVLIISKFNQLSNSKD